MKKVNADALYIAEADRLHRRAAMYRTAFIQSLRIDPDFGVYMAHYDNKKLLRVFRAILRKNVPRDMLDASVAVRRAGRRAAIAKRRKS